MSYWHCENCDCEIIFDYSADNDCWNEVVGEPEGFLCINCFVAKAKAKGIEPKFVRLFVIDGEFSIANPQDTGFKDHCGIEPRRGGGV